MKQKQRDQIILPASRGAGSTTVLDRAFARVKGGKVFAKPQRTGSTSVAASSARRPGPRGHKGRGLGEAQLLHPIREMRGTNYQVCGLFPFPMGGGSPLEGVPLGRTRPGSSSRGRTDACAARWTSRRMRRTSRAGCGSPRT